MTIVVATGETASVREFVEKSFAHGRHRHRMARQGPEKEEGVDGKTGRVLVKVDHAISAPPRSISCKATPLRPNACWAGPQKPASANWSATR